MTSTREWSRGVRIAVATPIVAVIAYVAGYAALARHVRPTGANWYFPRGGTQRSYPAPWARDLFLPLGRVEVWISGKPVYLRGDYEGQRGYVSLLPDGRTVVTPGVGER